MEFDERIKGFAALVLDRKQHITTEEGAKNSLVLPFLQLMGYDVFDPQVVDPEFTADVGTKKKEKVDYAIMRDGQPIMLIECKCCGDPLDQGRANQLHRYFQNTPTARVSILTDGVRFKFFSDLDQPNIMDPKPFMEIDFEALDESLIPELRKLANDRFDVGTALSAAQDLKYTREIKKFFAQQLESPTDQFIRLFASEVYSGQLRANVLDEFRPRVIRAIKMHINDLIYDRLQSAMPETERYTAESEQPEPEASEDEKPGVVTTEEEMEGYLVVKAILREVVDPNRVTMRDSKSYCAILLDDNNRKPLCRLHFDTKQKYLGLLDEDKKETRHAIDGLNDIYGFADELKAAVGRYGE